MPTFQDLAPDGKRAARCPVRAEGDASWRLWILRHTLNRYGAGVPDQEASTRQANILRRHRVYVRRWDARKKIAIRIAGGEHDARREVFRMTQLSAGIDGADDHHMRGTQGRDEGFPELSIAQRIHQCAGVVNDQNGCHASVGGAV